MTGPHSVAMSFRRDSDAVKGRKIERDVLKRVLGLCRPYRRQLVGFLVTVILALPGGAILLWENVRGRRPSPSAGHG